MIRFEDWPVRLSAFLEASIDKPFVWGECDCMIFCADAILEMTGLDKAYDVRGTYDTKEEADEIIAVYGENVEALLDDRLGERKSVKFCHRGDIVTYDYQGTICAGVVDDTGKRAAFMTETGLTRIPLKLCRTAWTV